MIIVKLDEYDNEVVLGDFNFNPSSLSMFSFMDSQNFVNLSKTEQDVL